MANEERFDPIAAASLAAVNASQRSLQSVRQQTGAPQLPAEGQAANTLRQGIQGAAQVSPAGLIAGSDGPSLPGLQGQGLPQPNQLLPGSQGQGLPTPDQILPGMQGQDFPTPDQILPGMQSANFPSPQQFLPGMTGGGSRQPRGGGGGGGGNGGGNGGGSNPDGGSRDARRGRDTSR